MSTLERVMKVLDDLGYDVKKSSNFANDLNADSLDLVEITLAMEDEFKRDVPDELSSVPAVVEYIDS